MNYEWTAEEHKAKETVAGLFGDDVTEELDGLDELDLPALKNALLRHLARLGDVGYLDLLLGPDRRKEAVELIAGQEVLAGKSGSLFLSVETTARMFGGLLGGFSEPDRLGDIKAMLSKGAIVAGFAVSESERPESGCGFLTKGIREKEGYLVNGSKSFAVNAPIADWLAVYGTAEGRHAFFLVPSDAPGLTIGRRLKTMGYGGLAVAGVELCSVSVPMERVLGPFDDERALEYVRLMQDLALTVASVGLMQRTIDASKSHAGTHVRGGRVVGKYQEIRFKLAEMLTMYQAAQLATYRAAWLYADSDPEAETIIRCAKVFAGESAEKVASMGMQIMAAEGYLERNPVERAYRDAKFASIAGTTSELARMSIADFLLKGHAQ